MNRFLASIGAACLVLVTTATALAAPNMAAPSMDAAARAAFDDAGSGAGTLAEAGATPTHLLIAEHLPDGSWALEYGFELDGMVGRIPLRVRQNGAEWETMWSPDPVYGTALANILRSGALPAATSERSWSGLRRMPSLPVIVTATRVITPFGVIEKTQPASGTESPQRGGFRRPTPTKQGPLPTSQELARHTERWIADVLGDDPAPAGFDLIVDASISWERFNAALFSVAGVGLYIGEIVAAGPNGLMAIPFAAPVSTATGKRPPDMVLALYPLKEGWGLRLVLDKKPVPTGSACPEPMAICPGDAAGLGPALTSIIGKRKVPRAMFASPGTTATADAIAWIEAVQDVLRLDPHRLFVGFIAL